MSNSSQSIRNYFSRYSEIRKNDSSNGAILFDALWKEIEKYSRNQASLSGNLFSFKKDLIISKDRYWKWSDSLKPRITGLDKVAVEGYKVVDNFFEAYRDLETGYVNYLSSKTKEDFSFILSINEESAAPDNILVEGKVFLDVLDFSNYSFKDGIENNPKATSKIILRGIDYSNEYIEEEISINEEGFYESTKEFLYLKKIPQNYEKKTSGGDSVSISGAKKYSINISNREFRDWLEEDEIWKKKVFKTNLLSIVDNYDLEGVLTNAITENFGTYHVRKDADGKSKISFIHRYFENNLEYKNLTYEELLEEVEISLFEGYFLNNNNEQINFADFYYSEKYLKLFGLSKSGVLYGYDLVKPKFVIGAFDRSTKSDLRIEIDNKYPIPKEISEEESLVNLKVLTSSPDFYIEKYIIFKHNRNTDSFGFLNEVDESYIWSTESKILNGIFNLDDYQDTVKMFEIEDEVVLGNGQIDYYVVSLRKNSENLIANINSDSTYNEIKRALIQCEQQGSSIYRNSIVAGVLKPSFEYDLGFTEDLTEAKINFKNLDGALEILENGVVYEFEEKRKYFLYDADYIYTLCDDENITATINNIDYSISTKEEILINTKLDSSGTAFGIGRDLSESLENFQNRVRRAIEERAKPVSKNSFDKALTYKINSNSKNEIVITDTNKVLNDFKVLNKMITINGAEYIYNKDFKFLKDLCSLLTELNITYETLKNYNEYTKLENLLKSEIKRVKIREEITKRTCWVSKERIDTSLEVLHSSENFREVEKPEDSLAKNEYFLTEEGRYVSGIGSSTDEHTLTYGYLDIPLVLTSCDIISVVLTNKDAEIILKEEDITLQDREKILSEKGAKILNTIYKTFNYYWGQ